MRRMQQHLPELEAYLHRIGEFQLLTAGEECELSRRARAGCDASRQALAVGNLRLVVMVACRFRDRGLDLADLVAEGNLGLLRAVEKFNPDAGCRFSTYAVWWIQQPIRRALERMRPVRLPSHMVARTAAWRRARTALAETLGRLPTVAEVAAKLGWSHPLGLGASAAATTADRKHLSLDTVRDDSDARLDETLADLDAPPPWESADRASELTYMRSLLEALDERSRRILELRYGIGQQRPLTLIEVGEIVQLTRERVRQIEQRALRQLQSAVG